MGGGGGGGSAAAVAVDARSGGGLGPSGSSSQALWPPIAKVQGPVVTRAAGLMGREVSDIPDLDDFLQQQQQPGDASTVQQQAGFGGSTGAGTAASAMDGSAPSWRGNVLFHDDANGVAGPGVDGSDQNQLLPEWTREPTRGS